MTSEYFPHSEQFFYSTYVDQAVALKNNKIDAFMIDEPLGRVLVAQNPGIEIVPDKVADDRYGLAFDKSKKELSSAFNEVLERYWEDGTIQALEDKWYSEDESLRVPEDIDLTGVNGTIVRGTNSASEPMSYIADGEVAGHEIDIVRMICAELGYGLEIVDMDFSSLIPSLVSRKIDVAAASISITEERALSVDFSVPDYYGGIVLIVRSSGDEAATSTLWDDISTSFSRTFIQEDRWKMLLQGLGTTLVISLFGVLFGTLLGVGVCFMRRSRLRWTLSRQCLQRSASHPHR